MRARTVLFLEGISATIFSLRSCTACARVLSLCMRLPARAGPPARDGSCSRTRRQRRKVGNLVWPIKSGQTNKHALLFYRYRYICILADHAEPCSATVPSQHWAAQNSLLLFPRSLPMSRGAQAAIKPRHHGRQSCLCPALISFMP